MAQSILANAGAGVRARAVLTGKRLDIRGPVRVDSAIADPAPIVSAAGQYAMAFRWGTLAMPGLPADGEADLLCMPAPRVTAVLPHTAEKGAILAPGAEQDRVDQDGVVGLPGLSLPRPGIIADPLARSAALAHRERTLAGTPGRREPAIALVRGRGAALDRKLTLIGEAVRTLLSLFEARHSPGPEVAVATLVAIGAAPTMCGLVVP